MDKTNKTPETINQMIKYVSGVKWKVESSQLRKELKELELLLKRMKAAPELHSSCSVDFKIDNPEFYLNKVKAILKEGNN